ncbi:hypothetical protein Clocl_2396 [Acetivibrio clariflavus DSM 19732]|uniref:Uncharacterized protein n=1 Tax=Acetivibrio clariflavus (strain DSM 19732 / NBRC 101661 / EBR45) TaxID=720554 RepID=G8LZ29_ACECE|nr:hypothetical protein Clocl_2396 [Acetivibrio clariflavus DSM 19732]
MKGHINMFITKLREKMMMYFPFIYIMHKTSYNSIGKIVIFKNSEDIYPCYFFTPFSNA